MKRLVPWLREPLVHFLAIGALFFLIFRLWGDGGPGSNKIVVTPGQIDSIVAGFARTWQRPPTEWELKGLIDNYVRDEIATREAMAMGLDRDDTIIRRRLRQKLEFLAEDAIDAIPPTDAELRDWLDRHSDDFRIEPEISCLQIYLNPEKRGETIRDDAGKLLSMLQSRGLDISVETLGDASMLPVERPLEPVRELARTFGEKFAEEVSRMAPGRWEGPVESAYGLHIVWVREKIDGKLPLLEDIRPVVEREFLADRRKKQLNAMYERMLERYQVKVEQRKEGSGTANAATGAERGELR